MIFKASFNVCLGSLPPIVLILLSQTHTRTAIAVQHNRDTHTHTQPARRQGRRTKTRSGQTVSTVRNTLAGRPQTIMDASQRHNCREKGHSYARTQHTLPLHRRCTTARQWDENTCSLSWSCRWASRCSSSW